MNGCLIFSPLLHVSLFVTFDVCSLKWPDLHILSTEHASYFLISVNSFLIALLTPFPLASVCSMSLHQRTNHLYWPAPGSPKPWLWQGPSILRWSWGTGLVLFLAHIIFPVRPPSQSSRASGLPALTLLHSISGFLYTRFTWSSIWSLLPFTR